MTLSSLGVIELDTFIPDVFGLQAFDSREPVTQMLPGQFGNLVRVLVLDNEATPVAFHYVILEDLVGIPGPSSLYLVR